MKINPIRSAIRKIGIDVHRYKETTRPLEWLKKENINSIIDIGANTGQFASEIRSVLPKANIYSFEPIKECFIELDKKMSGDEHFKSFNFALGTENTAAEINKNLYSPSSSLLPMAENHKILYPHTQKTTTETIEIKRLDDVFSTNELSKEILIKVDVQGYEDKVIEGGQNLFSRAKIILIETSFVTLYEGQGLFADTYERLRNLGFVYRGGYQQKIDNTTGKIIFEDSIFVRVD